MTEQDKFSLRGFKVQLRSLRKSTDLDSCLRWMQDSEVVRNLSMFGPVSEQEEIRFFDDRGKDPSNINFAIETLTDQKYIGNIGLAKINWQTGTAESGTLIGEKEFCGKGFGSDAKIQLLKYAFFQRGLRRIESRALDFNERSQRYSARCGYVVEGRLRQAIWKENKWCDIVLLSILRAEFEVVWQRYCINGEIK